MRLNLQSYKAALVTLAAMASLIVCLGFTVARLFEMEHEFRMDRTYSNHWYVTQAQFEAAILAESLARVAAHETFANPEQAPVLSRRHPDQPSGDSSGGAAGPS